MSVFRVHKTTNYTTMSNYHFKDKRLSLKAKGLLSIMLSLPDDWDYSAQGLATLSSDGETAVRSGLHELEEKGYLERTPIRNKGIFKDWQYDIYEMPKTLENIASEPVVENPQVDKPIVENPTQLNTNILNTKIINNNSTKVELRQDKPVSKPLIKTDTSNTPEDDTPKKKSRYVQCVEEVDKFTDNEELKSVLTTYLKMRLEMSDSPMYKNQWVGMLKKLRELSDSIQGQIEIVQQSINRGYKGFFEVKQYNKQQKGQDPSVFNEFGKVRVGKGMGGVLTNVQF